MGTQGLSSSQFGLFDSDYICNKRSCHLFTKCESWLHQKIVGKCLSHVSKILPLLQRYICNVTRKNSSSTNIIQLLL